MQKFLTGLAKKVGQYQLRSLHQMKSYRTKDDESIVTVVDEQSEKMIITAVKKQYPDSSFITEESGVIQMQNSRYQWIIDPLDGTNNYFHGVPIYALSIAVRDDAGLKFGVIYNSAMNELYYAERGKGAFLNNRPIRVSCHSTVKNGLFGTGFYYITDEDVVSLAVKRFINVQIASMGVRRPGSAAIDLAWVACGRYDAFWEVGLNSWDMAAGVLLVQEAGGIVTHIDGSEFDLFNRNILVSNPQLHNQMVQILNQ